MKRELKVTMKMKTIFLLLIVFLSPILFSNYIYKLAIINNDKQSLFIIWIPYVLIRLTAIIGLLFIIKNTIKLQELIKVLFFSILVLEGILTIAPVSMGGSSLLRLNWIMIYYHPLNSHGFRDDEFDFHHKKTIAFIGDSFTSGIGLKSIKDRYDKVCGEKLRFSANLINLGQPNTGSQKQLNHLKKFTSTSDIVVYQYYMNDFDETIKKMSKEDMLPFDEDKLNTVLKNPLLSFSYIGNTIFWMFPKYWIDFEKNEKYLALWKSETIMSEHKKELQEIIDYCSLNKKKLYVLVFPEFTSIEFSNALYVNEICNFFVFQGVKVLNVSKIINNTPPQFTDYQ